MLKKNRIKNILWLLEHLNITRSVHYTRQEKRILEALFNGKTRKEITKLLEINRESLRKHISNIRKKQDKKPPK